VCEALCSGETLLHTEEDCLLFDVMRCTKARREQQE
jgi:hypothetical protein